MNPIYPARPIKRRRRTKAQVEQLDEQIIDVLVGDHPQSIRHVFYRMTNPRLPEPVAKSENGYQQVQDRITKLRRSGRIPYGWIVDATRRGYHTATYSGPDDFVRRMRGLYRADLWRDADAYVEVWVESRSIAGVIQDDCEELAVSLYPCGGFSSISFVYEAAQTINVMAADRPAVLIYIGDYDPAGVLIDECLERELREHLDEEIDATIERIAVTPEQIAEYNLPAKPRKSDDRRALHVTEAVEAEAMPSNTLRTMLRERIEAFLPTGALDVAKAAEESEQKYLLRWADIMSSCGPDEAEALLFE